MKWLYFLIVCVLSQNTIAGTMSSGVGSDEAYEQITKDCDPRADMLPYPHIGVNPDPKSILNTQEDLTTFQLNDTGKTLKLTSRLSIDRDQFFHVLSYSVIYSFNVDLLYEDITAGQIDGTDGIPEPVALKSFWLIDGGRPEYTYTSTEQDIEFTPQRPGLYVGQLIVKQALPDGSIVCGGREFNISVSNNPKPVKVHSKLNLHTSAEDLKWQKDLNLKSIHKISKGKGVTIAVIDSGVNFNHLGLRRKIIFDSKTETGYDFVDSDKLPFDGLGHGSHVAGLIVGDQIGVAPEARIIPYRVTDNLGKGSAKLLYLALKDAVNRNVDLINISMAFPDLMFLNTDFKTDIEDVLKLAESKGILVVAAAGNGNEFGHPIDVDRYKTYLSAFNLSNIVVVAARGTKKELAVYSNFGKESVDLVAFGGDRPTSETEDGQPLPTNCDGECKEILSFGFRDKTATLKFHGTSMATPIVTGALAVMKSYKPNATAQDLVSALLSSVDKSEAYADKLNSGGELNILRALESLKNLK